MSRIRDEIWIEVTVILDGTLDETAMARDWKQKQSGIKPGIELNGIRFGNGNNLELKQG